MSSITFSMIKNFSWQQKTPWHESSSEVKQQVKIKILKKGKNLFIISMSQVMTACITVGWYQQPFSRRQYAFRNHSIHLPGYTSQFRKLKLYRLYCSGNRNTSSASSFTNYYY